MTLLVKCRDQRRSDFLSSESLSNNCLECACRRKMFVKLNAGSDGLVGEGSQRQAWWMSEESFDVLLLIWGQVWGFVFMQSESMIRYDEDDVSGGRSWSSLVVLRKCVGLDSCALEWKKCSPCQRRIPLLVMEIVQYGSSSRSHSDCHVRYDRDQILFAIYGSECPIHRNWLVSLPLDKNDQEELRIHIVKLKYIPS